MIFVSSPYTSESPLTIQFRVEKVTQFVDRMLDAGLMAFSPIIYGEALRKVNPTRKTDAVSWMKFNFDMLRRCESMFVLCLAGWEESKGVRLEIQVCNTFDIVMVRYNEDFELMSTEYSHVGVVEKF